jgi:hypothetical protein
MPATVCTIATINAIKDLKVFLYTLELFNPELPNVYLLCDTPTSKELPALYKGVIHVDTSLDKYGPVSRKRMTNQKGDTYKTRWEDFMMEKATVMDNAFKAGETEIFFFDSDICFMGMLPLIPGETHIGVSRHMIKPIDEDRYGMFNAGFVWTNDKEMPTKWRQASHNSRFYDQAALEDVVQSYKTDNVYCFPIQNNYGWWRLFQGSESANVLKTRWSMFRNESIPSVGIRIEGSPLLSIHTHWDEVTDMATRQYNLWVLGFLIRLGKHQPANELVKFLTKEFTHLHV